MRRPSDLSLSSSVLVGFNSSSADAQVNEAESLYRAGRIREALANCQNPDTGSLGPESALRVKILRGMALFDLGECTEGVEALVSAEQASRSGDPDLQFAAAFALFVRQADFQSPDEALLPLSRLRQLALIAGEAQSLAGLHFAVARLEGYRGLPSDAFRHLEIARRFADRAGHEPLRCTLDVVGVSLACMAGDLERARALGEASLLRAKAAGFHKYVVASEANLAAVSLYRGDIIGATTLARGVMASASDMPSLRLGILETLAQVKLHQEDYGEVESILQQCDETIASQRLPARSWYDLAHQVTRCVHLERLERWSKLLEIAEDTEPELERRQFRSLRTQLLCVKARALARLGELEHAEMTLRAAVRACPRGSIEPLIVLEASQGLCRFLAGNVRKGRAHFARALAACRVIGHRYHQAWIERTFSGISSTTHGDGGDLRSTSSSEDANGILGDVSAVLSAGHSVDVLAHRVVTLLEQTTLSSRVRVQTETGKSYRPESSVEHVLGHDGSSTIHLRGSDKHVSIHVSEVTSLEDFALLKSAVDLVKASIRRTSDSSDDDGAQRLWPETTPANPDDVVFRSPRMVELLRVAMRLADAELPILIMGETGTGKEVLARYIHGASPAARGPFAAFNCSAIPKDLVESQLFGHRRGAFTGAVDSSLGVIRTAERGTLFLDEIGDLDIAVQPKLLRFLESSEVHPVGETKPQSVRVRIVTATNADLEGLVAQNRFRADLFYRIGTAKIELPPLRERKDEIPALASLFLDRFCRECRRRDLHLGDDFIAALLLYDWPGNIRQLANEVRRVVAMSADGETLRTSSLSAEIARGWNVRGAAPSPAPATVSIRLDQSLDQAVADLERRFIEHALATAGGRVTDAAQLLGLSRKGLFLKRRRQGLIPR